MKNNRIKNIILSLIAAVFLLTQSSLYGQTVSPSPSPAKKSQPASPKRPAPVEKSTDATKAADAEKKAKQEKFEDESDKKKVEWISKTMEFGIQKDRKEAINYIPTVKDSGRKRELSIKLLDLIAKENDASVLVKAITIASELKLTEGADIIKSKLNHESDDVRISATYALKDLKAEQTKPFIIEQLKKHDFTKASIHAEAMIQTLADFRALEIKDFATEKIKDNKTAMSLRLALILFLGRAGATEAKPFLITQFKDQNEDTEVRSYCVNALARLDAKEVVPDINKIIDEIETYSFQKKKQYTSFQIYCVSALVKLGDESAYPRLLNSLKNDNPTTRVHAIKLIKDLKDKRAIDILKYKMNYDPSLTVQKAARDALKAMDVDVGTEKEEKKPISDPKSATPAKEKKKSSDKSPADDQEPDDVKKRDDF